MFSKKDLDSGNVVEIRNGQKFLYHNIDRNKILDIRGYNYLKLTNYDENFNCMTGTSPIFDIVKVYRDYTCKEVLWERKKKPELTDVEKAILKNYLSKGYKWIARDKEDDLYVYINNPLTMSNTLWISSYAYSYGCDITSERLRLFQFIKRGDDEPYSIEYLLEE